MDYVNSITKDNFHHAFDLKNLLEKSVFYPSSGLDGSNIRFFWGVQKKYNSFIHVDYSEKKETLEEAMRNDFALGGLELIGLKELQRKDLEPERFIHLNYQLQKYEMDNISRESGSFAKRLRELQPFALWGVYRDPKNNAQFSLLHIGGEACSTYEALYLSNNINPRALVLVRTGEWFGDNWTRYTDPNYRLHQAIRHTHLAYGAPMPCDLYTGMLPTDSTDCFWPDYRFTGEKRQYDGWERLLFRHRSCL